MKIRVLGFRVRGFRLRIICVQASPNFKPMACSVDQDRFQCAYATLARQAHTAAERLWPLRPKMHVSRL